MKPTAKTKKAATAADDDPRFAAVVDALAADPALAAIAAEYAARRQAGGQKKFGANGLKVKGKLFAMVSRGKLVVKLPKKRVEALVAARQGENFDPGHGRLMKEWVAVSSPKVSWIELVREAHDFVAGKR
jgi:hypothetical protein